MAESAVSNETGGDTNEAHPNSERGNPEGQRRQGRLRRVPDLLPVGLQDVLHRRQPEVREQVKSDRKKAGALHLPFTILKGGNWNKTNDTKRDRQGH